MDITQVSIIHHAALVLLLLWIFSSLGCAHPFLYFGSVLYLYKVNVHYSIKLRRRLQFEESKYANQRRLLSDSESVRWLNHAIEKIWPICMEQIASQQFLLPIIPWFLDKYKPWIALKAVVQHLYLGRRPPMFTEIRVLGESANDDHLVLELGMSFLSADDMNGIFEVQLRKRLGLGIRANLHVTGMHVEGKVLVGVKFLRHWPFLGRMRVCFVEPPYFQMTVKPIFNHGVDVTELPGIAGWVDNILAAAFEQTLVEPNMLVVDVEKFVSAPKENWFTVDEKQPIAFVILEVVEAADLKSSDMNGLSDPYVKGQLGPIRFRTKIQKKTLAPKWLQEFKIPICSWEAPNVLLIEVRDKDTIFDDTLGDCSIKINNLRGGQRHDKWFTLQNIKKGRLHLAITVLEDEHVKKSDSDKEPSTSPSPGSVTRSCSDADVSFHEGRNMADEFEPINIEGQLKTGIWVHHPGSEVCQTWEPRKGRDRRLESRLQKDIDSIDSPRSAASGSLRSDTNDNDDQEDGSSHHRRGMVRKGLHKIGAIFHRSPKNDGSTHHGKKAIRVPRPNLRAVGDKGISVKLVVDDGCAESLSNRKAGPDRPWIETGDEESLGTGHVGGETNKNEDYSALKFTSVLSRKDSDKFKEDQVSGVAAREASRRADSSNQDTKDYPPTVGEVPVDVTSLSDLDRGLANAEDEKEPT